MNDPMVCQVCGQSEENAEKPWRARVAELEADAKVLDWLEKTVWNGDISMFHSAVADRMCITYRDDGINSRQNHGRCLRDAILSAMEVKP